MNKLLLLLAMAGTVAPAAAAERRFSVTDFDRVQVEGPFSVTLRTGLPSAAVAEGSPRALDRVKLEVVGRLLKVKTNISAWGGYPGEQAGPVTIALTTRTLRGAEVRGNGSLAIDKAGGLKFAASLSGSGNMTIDRLETDRADLALLGSGSMRLAGKAKLLKASVQGSGDLAAGGLKADDVDLIAGTSGTIAVQAVRTAKVNAAGAGDVTIAGKPACTVTARGSGNVACGR